MKILEDGVWRYYNCPDRFWSEKCQSCRAKVAAGRAPVQECIDCWKVEIWAEPLEGNPGPHDEFTGLVDFVTESGYRVVAKASRAPILVVRTGMPRDAYPESPTAYLLMLYAKDISERDALRDAAESCLSSLSSDFTGRGEPMSCLAAGFLRTKRLPVRRGCWRFDDVLGPWQSWYPEDRDYGK